MAKGAYIGVSDKARKVKACYVGVGGKAKRVIKVYVGDANGKARLCWSDMITFYVSANGVATSYTCPSGYTWNDFIHSSHNNSGSFATIYDSEAEMATAPVYYDQVEISGVYLLDVITNGTYYYAGSQGGGSNTVNINSMDYDIESGWTWWDFVSAYANDGFAIEWSDDYGDDVLTDGMGNVYFNTTTGDPCYASDVIDTNYEYYA